MNSSAPQQRKNGLDGRPLAANSGHWAEAEPNSDAPDEVMAEVTRARAALMADLAGTALDWELPRERRADAAREAVELTDYEWSGYTELNGDECLEFDELVENDHLLLEAVDAFHDQNLTAEQRNGFGALLSERLWSDKQAAIVDQIAEDEDEYDEEKTDLARHAAATMTDIVLLAGLLSWDTDDFIVLGALENPIADSVVVDRASRHDSSEVRLAAVLHPQVTTSTLNRVRLEAVSAAEIAAVLGGPEGMGSELMKSIYRQKAAKNRDLVAVVDQQLAYLKRTGSHGGYDATVTYLDRAATAAITDIDDLACYVTPGAQLSWALGALENRIATSAIVAQAAQHPHADVRRAAALHPLVLKRTLLRLRTESVNNAEVLDGYNAESVILPEPMKWAYRQQAADNRDLVAIIDQQLAARAKKAGK